MSERIIDAIPTVEPSAAVKQLEQHLSSTPRTLWGDAWRRFLRHKLALIGSAMLIFFTVAVLIGPLIYRINPETLDFNALSARPSHEAASLTVIAIRAVFGGSRCSSRPSGV